jgi:tRNA pseudouridine38-40 synthase
MRTFKLTLAYDGTHYAGWQLQQGPVTTLQGTLERVLEKITGESIRVAASGRTDAGVHALGQVVSFRSSTHLSADVFQRALNAELPRDMAALEVVEAPDDFHATRCARRKRYRYVIDDQRLPDVFIRAYAWQIFTPLDVAAMHRAAQALLGTHDFSSFETSGSRRETSVRTIYDISVERPLGRSMGLAPGHWRDASGTHGVVVEVEANGFLYNMVRAIVGSLVEIGRGTQPEMWLSEVLAARNREVAGQTAPPQGLFLVKVDYGREEVDGRQEEVDGRQ